MRFIVVSVCICLQLLLHGTEYRLSLASLFDSVYITVLSCVCYVNIMICVILYALSCVADIV